MRSVEELECTLLVDHWAEFGLEMLIDVHAQESNKYIAEKGPNCECDNATPNIKQQSANTNHIINSTGTSLRDPQLAFCIHGQEMSWPSPTVVQLAMKKVVFWKVER